MEYLKQSWRDVAGGAAFLYLGVFVWGLITAVDRPGFVATYLDGGANILMAGAAIWAVGAAKDWREEVRGKGLHDLAAEASTLGREIEYAHRRAVDLWRTLANVPTNQLGELRGFDAELSSVLKKIPPMVARLDGIAGVGTAGPFHFLRNHVEDLKTGMHLHAEQRRNPPQQGQYEPVAGLLRAAAGYHDLPAIRAIVTSLADLIAEWAGPHMGASRATPMTAADILKRLEVLHARAIEMRRKGMEAEDRGPDPGPDEVPQ